MSQESGGLFLYKKLTARATMMTSSPIETPCDSRKAMAGGDDQIVSHNPIIHMMKAAVLIVKGARIAEI